MNSCSKLNSRSTNDMDLILMISVISPVSFNVLRQGIFSMASLEAEYRLSSKVLPASSKYNGNSLIGREQIWSTAMHKSCPSPVVYSCWRDPALTQSSKKATKPWNVQSSSSLCLQSCHMQHPQNCNALNEHLVIQPWKVFASSHVRVHIYKRVTATMPRRPTYERKYHHTDVICKGINVWHHGYL